MNDHLREIEDYLERSTIDGELRSSMFDTYLRVEQVKASRRIAEALERLQRVVGTTYDEKSDATGVLRVTTPGDATGFGS